MFKKEYQGGSHVMVLSAQGKDPTAHCKLTGSVSLRYDKEVRGYVHVLEGDSITTRLQLPASDRTSLSLQQPFLVLQAAVQRDARFAVELCLQDAKGGRRRVNFSSSVKEPSISTLIARVPFVTTATGEWCNFCFDLPSLMAELFPGHAHKSLESLVVGGACLLRRVFTMRERPRGSNEVVSEGGVRDIPEACQMMIEHIPISTQMMSSVIMDHQKTTGDRSGCRREPQSSRHPPTHVAFGKKVTIPDHILARQATSRSAGNARKKAQPSGAGVRQSSAPTAVGGVARVQRSGSSGRSQTKKLAGREERRTRERGRKEGNPLAGDELLALDVLGVQRLAPREGGMVMSGRGLAAGPEQITHNTDMEHGQPDMEHRPPDMQHGQADNSYLDTSVEEEEGDGEGKKEREEERGEREADREDQLFSYFSPPRSAGSAHTGSREPERSDRDVELNRDFLPNSNSGNEQGLPHETDQSDSEVSGGELSSDDEGGDGGIDDDIMEKGIPLASGLADELNQTRLSDDYDWRLYASRDDTPPSPQSPKTLLHLPIDHHGNSTTPEPDTSTLSMTDKAAAHPLLDSLDTRGMGGALSPEQDQPVLVDQSNQSDEELELMYDPQLCCFFDPVTHKYYELIQ